MRRIVRNHTAEARDEIAFHLESLVAENIAAGMTPDAARDAAQRRFGDVAQIADTLNHVSRQRARRMRFSQRIETITQDLRIATRQLARTPMLALVVIITVALGIGANSAIFSVVYSVLLRPLPFANADRIVVLRERNGATDTQGMFVTVGNYAAWAEQSREFEAIGAYYFGGFTLTGSGDPQRLSAVLATASFWKALAIRPALGRYFTEAEDHPGGARVVVLSYATWQSTFAGDSSVVGRAISLSGEPYEVIGVAAREYALTPRSGAIWVPIAFPQQAIADHGDHELTVLGLVRRGATTSQAIGELRRIETELAKTYPNGHFDGGIIWRSERDTIVGSVESVLLIALGAVALVLLIACVNVANLLLGRASARRKEMAVRAALGAGRGRLVAQLLVESIGLSMVGAVAGIALAEVGIRILVTAAPPLMPRLGEASLNAPVLIFSIALAMLCGVAFGLAPAIRASRLDLQGTLRGSAQSFAWGARDRLRAALVVAEVAVSLVLLVGAGLCVRSAVQLNRVEPGFDPSNLLVSSVSLSAANYPSDTSVTRTFEAISTTIGAIPGVASATLVSRMPIASGGFDCSIVAAGKPQTPENSMGANFRTVAPNYFATVRTPVLGGRTFTAADGAGAPAVVMLTAGLARELFGATNPIGQRVTGCIDKSTASREVVGMVGDVRANGIRSDVVSEIYYPAAQVPQRSMWLAVRGNVPVTSLTAEIRKAVASIDPRLPLASMSTMNDVVRRTLATQRFMTTLLVLLGMIGAVLAAVGIYGVISYLVTQRTQEIGVRMALGAQATRVAGLVVGQGLALTLVGVVIGSIASVFAMRVLSGLLFQVTPRDPLTLGAAAALLTIVAMLASFVPAWRATRVDPLVALRSS